MFWLAVLNFIMLGIGYEILRRTDEELTERIKFIDVEWYFTKGSVLFLGWLLIGGYYSEEKLSKKSKIYFEICRLYTAVLIYFFFESIYSKLY